MFGNDRRMSQDLDNHITGHYGEDQYLNNDQAGEYMSNLQKQFINETGVDPCIMNQVGYHNKYVEWLEAKIEKLTPFNILLKEVDSHWREFGPDHGFSELMDKVYEVIAQQHNESKI